MHPNPSSCARLQNTIEENILHKSDQKRQLDWLAIQSGGFNTDFLSKLNIRDFFDNQGASVDVKAAMRRWVTWAVRRRGRV